MGQVKILRSAIRTVVKGFQPSVKLRQDGRRALRATNKIDGAYPLPQSPADILRLIAFENFAHSLQQPFQPRKNYLTVIATSECRHNCVMCYADSRPEGESLSLADLSKMPRKFFSQFKTIHFGLEGDPLRTSSVLLDGSPADLADFIELFYRQGLRKFALTIKGVQADDPDAQRTYRRVLEFFAARPKAKLTLRLSFNLFEPRDFKEDQTDFSRLEEEFLAALIPALGAKNITPVIILLGSFKRSRGHIYQAAAVLRDIMDRQQFVEISFIKTLRDWVARNPKNFGPLCQTVQNSSFKDLEFFELFMKNASAESQRPDYYCHGNTIMRPNRLARQKQLADAAEMVRQGADPYIAGLFHCVGLPLDGSADFSFLAEFSNWYYGATPSQEEKMIINPFGINPKASKSQQNIPISNFIHRPSGQIIPVQKGNAYSFGRYSALKDKGEDVTLDLPDFFRSTGNQKKICPLFLNQRFTLNPDGSLQLCDYILRSGRPLLGHISEPTEELEARYQRIMERAREACRQNLEAIMKGEYSTWVCEHPEWLED